ncbi:hypothetical protein OS176_02510 [Xanthomonadaceae bacterium XH05]|nr:hypothetical protein [Xanthomonadaceae bacterium XH05]
MTIERISGVVHGLAARIDEAKDYLEGMHPEDVVQQLEDSVERMESFAGNLGELSEALLDPVPLLTDALRETMQEQFDNCSEAIGTSCDELREKMEERFGEFESIVLNRLTELGELLELKWLDEVTERLDAATARFDGAMEAADGHVQGVEQHMKSEFGELVNKLHGITEAISRVQPLLQNIRTVMGT